MPWRLRGHKGRTPRLSWWCDHKQPCPSSLCGPADGWNWCLVPDGGADAIFFAGGLAERGKGQARGSACVTPLAELHARGGERWPSRWPGWPQGSHWDADIDLTPRWLQRCSSCMAWHMACGRPPLPRRPWPVSRRRCLRLRLVLALAAMAIFTICVASPRWDALVVLLAGAVYEIFAYEFNLGHVSNASALWLGMRPADIFVYVFLPPFLLDLSVRVWRGGSGAGRLMACRQGAAPAEPGGKRSGHVGPGPVHMPCGRL